MDTSRQLRSTYHQIPTHLMRNTWGETFRLSWNAMQSISAVDGKIAKDVRQNTKWRRFTVNKWFLNNMNEKDLNYIIKCFYNEKTEKTYRSLSHAKKSSKTPYVYRAWIQNGKILDKELIYAYGQSVATIKRADEEIYKRLIK